MLQAGHRFIGNATGNNVVKILKVYLMVQGPTGRTVVVRAFGSLWSDMAKSGMQAGDPLDPKFLASLPGGT